MTDASVIIAATSGSSGGAIMSEAGAAPKHFMYYPGNYRWSAEMLVVFSTIPYGGAEFSEADRIARRLLSRVGDAQHCQRDYLALAVDTVCDWLEEKFK
jgi:hypothetical protein